MTNEEFKIFSSTIPTDPGVYRFFGDNDVVLYVGKAKNLRNRLRSYFNNTDDRYNVPFLLERLRDIETLVTEDERQAIFDAAAFAMASP